MASSSWAQKTGFKPVFSAETKAGQSLSRQPDLEASPVVSTPSQAVNDVPHGDKVPPSPSDGVPTNNARVEERTTRLPVMVDHDDLVLRRRPSPLNYELTDSPALVFLAVYGIQHYLSIIGSLILTPLVIAPAMGASHDETAAMVCTVLLVSGVTTLLHTIFGSRLPLIQGPSFVYLAPVLAIINSPEFQELNENKFKHIMKELQGAIIIGSAFQTLLGYTGLMSLLVRFINPVVVSSTIAAVGLFL